MKMHVLALGLSAGLALGSRAGVDAAARISATVDLDDGSRLVGEPQQEAVTIRTRYAAVDLAWPAVASIAFAEDGETVFCALDGGDRISGVLQLATLPLMTLFGRVEVPLGHVKRITVVRGEAGAQLHKGLVLHFAFDEEGERVKDLSGTGNEGQRVEAQRVSTGGGGVCRLDGENDHVEVTNSVSLEVRKEVTVAAWVKLASFGPGGYGNEHGYIVNKGDDLWWNPAFCLGYAKASGSGAPRWPAEPGPLPALFHVCREGGAQSGGGETVESETQLATNVWYHLAGTYDGARVRLFVNGKLEGEKPYQGLLRPDRAPVHIGGGKLFGVDWGNQFTVNGWVDDVMIWNRALLPAEVEALCRRSQMP